MPSPDEINDDLQRSYPEAFSPDEAVRQRFANTKSRIAELAEALGEYLALRAHINDNVDSMANAEVAVGNFLGAEGVDPQSIEFRYVWGDGGAAEAHDAMAAGADTVVLPVQLTADGVPVVLPPGIHGLPQDRGDGRIGAGFSYVRGQGIRRWCKRCAW